MSEAGEGDIAVVLSSELIAKITQEYFNKVMFKQKVEIVDLKPASDGYMFSVAFVKKTSPALEAACAVESIIKAQAVDSYKNNTVRAANGKFTKVKE